jgi:CheY-like chemotaxis protein
MEEEVLKKILIVDDESDYREAGGRIFRRRLRANITTIDNGEDAIELARTNAYDLILLDLSIPKRNGWEVIREIREFDTNVKIVVLTGNPKFTKEEEQIIASQTSGAFCKPLMIQKLMAKIAELFGESIIIDPIWLKPETLKGRPEAREIVHALNGLNGTMRIRCDEYFYAFEHGFYKDLSSEEHIQSLQHVLKDVLNTIAVSKKTIENIRKL